MIREGKQEHMLHVRRNDEKASKRALRGTKGQGEAGDYTMCP